MVPLTSSSACLNLSAFVPKTKRKYVRKRDLMFVVFELLNPTGDSLDPSLADNHGDCNPTLLVSGVAINLVRCDLEPLRP